MNGDKVYYKMNLSLEGAQNKKEAARVFALAELISCSKTHDVREFMEKNNTTLLSLCTKLDKKSAEECNLIVKLMSIVAIQTGAQDDDAIDEPMAELRKIITNSEKTIDLRCSCAHALAIITKMSCGVEDIIAENVSVCQSVWQSIEPNSEHSNLFITALRAWCVLLLNANEETTASAFEAQPELIDYLYSENLKVKTAATEALAFLHELTKDVRPESEFPNHQEVLESLDDLVNEVSEGESQSVFRDAHGFISGEHKAPRRNFMLGSDTRILRSYADTLFYDMCSEILRGGMLAHLKVNEEFRSVFNLGRISNGNKREEIMKPPMMASHEEADKWRTQCRGRERDEKMEQVL